ncbi:hypothetical protein D3C76_1461230 [compost metagenome]
MPAVQGFIQPSRDFLIFNRHPPVGLGSPHQILQGFLAQLDLVLQHRQVFLQQRIVVVLAHFLDQHAHGCQRRTQLMGGTRGLGRNRQ